MDVFLDFAALDANDAIGSFGKFRVVRHEDERRPFFLVHIKNQVFDHVASFGVQVAGRFIRKEDLWLVGKSPGNRHTLLFTTGKLAGIMGNPITKAYLLKQGLSFFFGVFSFFQFQGYHHILQGSEGRQKLEVLEDKTHVLVSDGGTLVLGKLFKSLSIEYDRARGSRIQTGTKAEQSGLATAGGPDDRDAFTFGNIEIDLVQDGELSVAALVGFGNVFYAEDGHKIVGLGNDLKTKMPIIFVSGTRFKYTAFIFFEYRTLKKLYF